MKAKLQIVQLAYGEHACLHFRVPVNRAEAAELRADEINEDSNVYFRIWWD